MKKLLFIALALLLVLAVAPTIALAADTYPETITVAGTPITSGQYYVSNGNGGITSATENPSDGYVYYDNSTGVLTLNNISITTSGDTYGIADTKNSYALTISLEGSNSIQSTGNAGGVYLSKVDCTITGAGSLSVSCQKMSALYVKSLTVESTGTLSFTSNGTADDKAIESSRNILLKSGTITATGGTGISSTYDSITIEGTADVTATGKNNYAIHCGSGTFSMTSGSLDADSAASNSDTVWAKEISVAGGALEIGATYCSGLCASSDVTIGGTANVTINTAGTCIYSMYDDVTVSGGTVSITSSGSNAIYTDSGTGGKILVSGGTLNASAYYPTLWGTSGVDISGGAVTAISVNDVGIYSSAANVSISGGTVTAISTNNMGIYSPANVSIRGGTVAAAGGTNRYSIYAYDTLTIDGDAVVYGKYISSTKAPSLTEGVVYTGTDVSLDSDGKTVLSGGVGTVYGDPNVTGFATPESAALSTALDADYIEIRAQDMTYSGSPLTPTPTVTVTKTAISRELVEGVDYTVVSLEGNDYTNVGEKTYKIQAVANSGCTGEKEFSCKVVEKELSWDAAGLGVSKTEDGKTDAAPVQGTLKLAGVAADDDVTLAYDGITAPAFPDAKAGSYTLTLTVTGAKLAGADKDNYKLPTADITVTAKIEAAAPVVTPAPDPTPEASTTPAPDATATPAPTAAPTAAPEASATPAPTATPKATQAPATAPSTGDDSHAALWLLPLLAAVALLVVFGKKRARGGKIKD